MEPDLCPRSHAGETRTAVGLVLCAACVRQVERSLRALPGLHQECLHHMTSSARRISNPTKVSGTRKRDHLNVSALDARYNITAVLGSWAQIVLEEFSPAGQEHATVLDHSVTQLVRFLLDHLQWLAAQPPAGDFADEIDALAADLLRVVDPEHGSGRTPSVACVVEDCPGDISASAQTSAGPGGRSISCSAGHAWNLQEWLVLRRLLEQRQERQERREEVA